MNMDEYENFKVNGIGWRINKKAVGFVHEVLGDYNVTYVGEKVGGMKIVTINKINHIGDIIIKHNDKYMNAKHYDRYYKRDWNGM